MDQSYWSISDILADSTRIPCHFKLDLPGLSHLRGDAAVLAQELNSSSSSSSQASSSRSSEQDETAASTIPKGTKLELPYWLAELFVLNDLVDISIPKPFSQRVRNALSADAKSVQLRGQGNYWYAVGSRLGGLMDSGMLMEVLSSTYTERLPSIYSSAQHLASSSRSGNVDLGSSLGGGGGGGGGSGGSSSGVGGGSGAGRGKSFGTSVGMSADMVEFVNGLDETEKVALRAAHDAAAATRNYLAARN